MKNFNGCDLDNEYGDETIGPFCPVPEQDEFEDDLAEERDLK